MKKLAINDYLAFKMDAIERINYSGVELEKGATYCIAIVEIIEPWKDWIKKSKLTGFNFYIIKYLMKPRLKTSNYYALCGGIGPNDNYIFEIGAGIEKFSPTINGELFVFANDYDKKWSYNNNKGKLKLKITRIK